MLVAEVEDLVSLFIDDSISIKEALQVMEEESSSYLLVTSRNGALTGVITWDSLLGIFKNNISLDSSIKNVMKQTLCIVKETQSLEELDFGEEDFVVVIKEIGHPIGILTREKFLTVICSKLNTILDTCQTVKDSDKSFDFSSLVKKVQSLIKERDDLSQIIEFSPDSIYVADEEGNTVLVNQAFEELSGVKRDSVLGKNTETIEKMGLFYPAVTPIVLKEKRKFSVLQTSINGNYSVVTGIPVFDEQGKIVKVISNSKDFQEFNSVSQYLNEFEGAGEQKSEILFVKGKMLICESPKMKEIVDLINQVADVDSTVLITGESGVGKDLIARFIHENSNRAQGEYIHINCGAIPESLLESELFGYETGAFTGAKKGGKTGLIEAASHGTLFLDEIGEMPLNLQVKLLNVLQNKKITRVGGTEQVDVDVRIICATNKDPEEMVREGKFRLDLYYRLNVIPIHIPPLRERREDIGPLVQWFLKSLNDKYHKDIHLRPEVIDLFLQYYWPGNVRELENMIERIVVVSTSNITLENLPCVFTKKSFKPVLVNKIIPLKKALTEVERQLVLMAYQDCKNSYTLGKVLDISQSSAHRKIQKYVNNEQ